MANGRTARRHYRSISFPRYLTTRYRYIETTTEARGGVTGQNVRYVLAFGLAGVVIAFVIIALYFYGVQF